MIKIKNLTKKFIAGDIETAAVNDVSFDVAAGEFLGIMGRSGSGKSTLLNIIGLLDSPTAGSYMFGGSEVAGLGERHLSDIRKHNIGFIFQSFNLVESLSVHDNIELPLLYQKVPSGQRKARILEIMERMKIDHRAGHFPSQLSGGQQQRVAVARALIGAPGLILADEPTGNLDSTIGNEVMDMLVEMKKSGKTVVMVTHSREHASAADRVINLIDGKISDIS